MSMKPSRSEEIISKRCGVDIYVQNGDTQFVCPRLKCLSKNSFLGRKKPYITRKCRTILNALKVIAHTFGSLQDIRPIKIPTIISHGGDEARKNNGLSKPLAIQ